MRRRRLTKKQKQFNKFNIFITLFCLACLTIFSYFIFRLNILPTKYLITGYGLSILIILFLLIKIYSKSKKKIKYFYSFLLFCLSLIFCFLSIYLNNTYHFIKGIWHEYETVNYSVIVLKNSNYKKINDLSDKNISYLNDNTDEIKKELDKKITYKEDILEEFGTLIKKLLNKDTDSIILEDSYLTMIKEEQEDFESKIDIIYTFKIKIKSHKEDSKIDVSKDSFILYISGIDQYGNVNSVRGRSDVNQLVVINPTTNKILLVNTPRDYYVYLDGITSMKDKLTHAGIYGINKSIKTLENLYKVDIDHYVRVNFNTLIKVVDVIGGIDIYSDKAFTPWTNKKMRVEKGWNHFNGEEALAYSRERKAYLDGDHHRGRNQQQVITAIIDKLTSSKVLISKYNSILNALDGSFQTDIPTSTLTSFIRNQLDKMPKWEVISIAVDGTGSYNYTYSMGKDYKLWVMEPNYDSVRDARNKINEVVNGK